LRFQNPASICGSRSRWLLDFLYEGFNTDERNRRMTFSNEAASTFPSHP
jgi:hypothetical protein